MGALIGLLFGYTPFLDVFGGTFEAHRPLASFGLFVLGFVFGSWPAAFIVTPLLMRWHHAFGATGLILAALLCSGLSALIALRSKVLSLSSVLPWEVPGSTWAFLAGLYLGSVILGLNFAMPRIDTHGPDEPSTDGPSCG